MASKAKCDESMMLNMSMQNDSNLKTMEDSLSSAIKSKNDLLQEVNLKLKSYLDIIIKKFNQVTRKR